jgi:tetratricopeptide (TPR) repeat protein
MSLASDKIKNEIQNNNWSGARNDLLQYTQANPNSAIAWYYLAQVDARTGDYVEGLAAINHADTIDPQHTFAGNFKAYQALEHNLHQYQQPLQPTPVRTYALTPPVAAPVVHKPDYTMWWVFGAGVVLVLLVAWIIAAHAKRKAKEEIARVEAKAERARRFQEDWNKDYRREFVDNRPVASIPTGVTTPPPPPHYTQATYQQPAPVVVNNNGRGGGYHNDGLLTGVILGEMMSGGGRSHDTYVERDTYVSAPAPSPAPSFDYGNDSNSGGSFDFGNNSGGFDSGNSGGSSDW